MKLQIFSLIFLAASTPTSLAFAPVSTSPSTTTNSLSSTCLSAKKATKKKKNTSSSAGLKGFGSTTKSSTTKDIKVPIDRSRETMNFYSYLEKAGAASCLKRVALGFFPFDENDTSNGLRGVVALQKINKGDVIIEIPYEAAFNLGKESRDPTLPGMTLLQEYCAWISGEERSEKKRDLGPYLSVLPKFKTDELGSTDFFSEDALDMLQSPIIKDETLARRSNSEARFERDVQPMTEISLGMYKWENDEAITEEHLRWASWLVTSRVLTVQGEAGTGDAFRLMIPLIDMVSI